MIPTTRTEPLATLQADPGWHYDDPVLIEKMAAGLRRHGQLRGLVVRTDLEGVRRVVDGRKQLQAMRLLGWETAWTVDVGILDDEASGRMALDLELKAEVDYARLAVAVAWLVDDKGAAPESLASASPFTAARISQLRDLASFDWDQFTKAADDGQHGFSWGEEEPAVPTVGGVPVLLGHDPADTLTDPEIESVLGRPMEGVLGGTFDDGKALTADDVRDAFVASEIAQRVEAMAADLGEALGLPDDLDAVFETERLLDEERLVDDVPAASRYGAPAAASWTQELTAQAEPGETAIETTVETFEHAPAEPEAQLGLF